MTINCKYETWSRSVQVWHNKILGDIPYCAPTKLLKAMSPCPSPGFHAYGVYWILSVNAWYEYIEVCWQIYWDQGMVVARRRLQLRYQALLYGLLSVLSAELRSLPSASSSPFCVIGNVPRNSSRHDKTCMCQFSQHQEAVLRWGQGPQTSALPPNMTWNPVWQTQVLAYRCKKKRSVAFEICFRWGTPLGSLRRSPDPLVSGGRDTPPHTSLHSAPRFPTFGCHHSIIGCHVPLSLLRFWHLDMKERKGRVFV